MTKAMLVGRKADVDAFAKLLIEVYGFKQNEIKKYITKKGSKMT